MFSSCLVFKSLSSLCLVDAPLIGKLNFRSSLVACSCCHTHLKFFLAVCFIFMLIYAMLACDCVAIALVAVVVVVFNSIRVQSIKIICKCQKILTVCGDVLQITFVIACLNVLPFDM